MKIVKLVLIGATAPMLAACEGGSPDRQPARENELAARVPAENRVKAVPESVVRQDILEETSVPEKARIEPVELTLDFSSADGELPETAAAALDKLLQRPIMSTPSCVVIRGHTDSSGSDHQNLEVSERRATLVGDYLARHGLNPNRISVVALGERRPAAPNANLDGSDNPEGRAKNRRVTVSVQPAAECSAIGINATSSAEPKAE